MPPFHAKIRGQTRISLRQECAVPHVENNHEGDARPIRRGKDITGISVYARSFVADLFSGAMCIGE